MKTILMLLLSACTFSSHPTQKAALGGKTSTHALIARIKQPGPLTVETVNSADWAVTRAGLINLDSAEAKAAKLEDGDEPIQVYFHAIRRPDQGLFIVDTGVERALRDAPDRAALRGVVARAMHMEKMIIHAPLGDWLAAQKQPLAGVFLTHLHLDHVSGMPDVPHGTPIYAGPGETTARHALNFLLRSNINRALEGQSPIREWQYEVDPDGRFAGVLDVFGDGSLFALHVPGHTSGSTAYLARTTTGPVLLTGDACHTAWGWHALVEPGSFSANREQSRHSLVQLERLVRENPEISVRLGHQAL